MKEETDKTWSENFVKRVAYSAGDGLGDGYEEFAQEIIDRLTSATIKAKEGMVKELIGKHNAHILNQYQLQGLGDERVLYKVLEKAGDKTKTFFGINLEEPNK